MKRLVAIDLPRRLAARVPRLLTEVLTGAGMVAIVGALRTLLNPLIGEGVPFAFTFLGIVLATLLAGWRAGTVALILGVLLVWYFVLPVQRSFTLSDPAMLWWLVLIVATQALIVFALGVYQAEMRRGRNERTRRISFLGHALREMDHRTRNNFQIVTSLLQLQANRSGSDEVKAALREAAERLQAVAAVYSALAPSSQGLATVRLQDQLEEICGQIRRGILPDGIVLETQLEPILVTHDTAVAMGIVVNELVTNACKHAFPEGRGSIAVRTRRTAEGARIEVCDDGCGMPAAPERKTGLGTRLIGAFVQRVHGTTDVRSSEAGTTTVVSVPLAA